MVDAKGEPMTEALELWKRDPVELVRELIGNPAFKDSLRYAPERILEELKGKVSRRYSEMWTADWWWETQVRQLLSFKRTFAHEQLRTF